MDLDGIHVHHAGLEQAAADLAATVRRLDARLDQLEGDLGRLRHGWAGSARAAHDTARARWETAIREMQGLLDSTGRAVQQSNSDYLAADARGARSFEF